MPFVGSSPSLNAVLQTFLAKTPIKNKLKKPSTPTAGRALPATIIYNCNEAQQTVVKDTFSRVTTKYAPHIRTWGGAGPTLADRLEQRTLANTWVSCKDCFPYGSLSFEDAGDGYPEIRVCTPVPPSGVYYAHLLFQEILVLAGATLLDVVILQTYFLSWDGHNGNVPAGQWSGPGDGFIPMCRAGRRLAGMYAGLLAGTYMVWDPAHGQVFVGKTVNPSEPGKELIHQNNWTTTGC